MRLANIAPTAKKSTLAIGVDSPRTRIKIPPDATNRDPTNTTKPTYSCTACKKGATDRPGKYSPTVAMASIALTRGYIRSHQP